MNFEWASFFVERTLTSVNWISPELLTLLKSCIYIAWQLVCVLFFVFISGNIINATTNYAPCLEQYTLIAFLHNHPEIVWLQFTFTFCKWLQRGRDSWKQFLWHSHFEGDAWELPAESAKLLALCGSMCSCLPPSGGISVQTPAQELRAITTSPDRTRNTMSDRW